MRDETPVAGIHSVRAALKHGADGVREIWLERSRRDRRLGDLAELAKSAGVKIRQMDRDALDGVAEGASHQGAIAWVSVPAARSERDLLALLETLDVPPFLLLLDEIQDPHNLGACLRTADAAGVHAVVAPKDNAVGLTPVVCKVASGAAETLPYIQVTNLARTMDALKERGIWLIGTAGESDATLFATDLTGSLGLVMGSEGSGLRRLTRARCDALVKLPMCGKVESLNVSVAAGVCLFEALRQRQAR
ncbi:23S rRNA (guanosine(2251)-2'-O)-methyltransferase RlmB [Thiorhodococcus minor]|uniref:23S rRNA (guanosine-2'-O-)-methyltransferase RlmB n=1 Tax=Thiorhodococcus minor TaxID=57489 RepID=A0A6M0JYB3_9GAMM|nr:23S rRNA (guanosine(2251)-2'-O)-methyltransferase RlmB [Thiorhodococcus minor]NEV62508.1 23S rRNA (guanosine(2251)-2'-O)-methyltransferase RlmB [Thiorhodococcus minor]